MNQLRNFTMARVGLGRAGDALPLREVLDFRLAHAAARDAVHEPLDPASLGRWPCTLLRSAVRDRTEYLRRPDLGRRLGSGLPLAASECDVAVCVVDGLSALAIHRHAAALLDRLIPKFADAGWKLSDLTLVEFGRVAIGDEIGAAMRAKIALVLIGERPGLQSPDSLGAYLTWDPRPGRTDAERNCISNIRADGLGYEAAAERIFALMAESMRRKLSGVSLKEERETRLSLPPDAPD